MQVASGIRSLSVLFVWPAMALAQTFWPSFISGQFPGPSASPFVWQKGGEWAAGVLSKGVELATNDAQRQALRSGGAELVYGLRPEDLVFADDGLPGTLTMIEPTGPETYLTAETAVGKLTARVPGNAHRRVGDRVHLRWSPEQAHLFDAAGGQRLA